MGSIESVCIPRTCKFLSAFFLFFVSFIPLYAQTAGGSAVSLAAEISRLENLSTGTGANATPQQERYNAFMALARLQQLSGNSEAALKAYEGALTVSPGGGRAMLEKARLLFSMGEYEKTAVAINGLLREDRDRELMIQGRYLAALLEAFALGKTETLTALSEDPDFIELRSGIYYSLWKLGAQGSWEARLKREFPESPEAKISGGAADPAQTPLWLLFPGRETLALSTPVPQAAPAAAVPAEAAGSPVLQTGLFGREENAKAMADQLKKAGFESYVTKRSINGSDYWAVSVPGGNDMNAAITRLKDAGFEAFPLATP